MAVDVLDPSAHVHLPGLGPSTGVAARTRGEASPLSAPVLWQHGLPILSSDRLALRELRDADAPPLLNLLAEREVSQFLAPPPQTRAEFRRFVRWTERRRADGRYACFAIVPRGMTSAVGFFQVRTVEAGAPTAEWGFVLGRLYWGTGLFAEGARLLVDFAFEHMAIRRLEARAITINGRANGALRKIGAVPEGVLRQSLTIEGRHYDTRLWSILDTDRRPVRPGPTDQRVLGGGLAAARTPVM